MVGPCGVGDQQVVNGGGSDAGVAERGVELGVGLRVGFQQGMDLLRHLRVIVFGLVPSAGGEIIETADAGAAFAEAGRHGVTTPTEELFGATWFARAVLEGHLGLELAATKEATARAPKTNGKKANGSKAATGAEVKRG